jgi:hypothetical protein
MTGTSDITAAAQLIGYALNTRLSPVRDRDYTDLVARFLADDGFSRIVTAIATGLDLVVLDVNRGLGLVVAPTAESPFAMTVGQYSRRANKDGIAAERVLHALAHLGIAALAFPRPVDLDDPAYVGRISASGVEAFMREAVERLARDTALIEGSEEDALVESPDLQAAWRVYVKRASTAKIGMKRGSTRTTTAIAGRTLAVLADAGMLVAPPAKTDDPVYRTTGRYRLQVREAAQRMFTELLDLGIGEITDGSGTVVHFRWDELKATGEGGHSV